MVCNVTIGNLALHCGASLSPMSSFKVNSHGPAPRCDPVFEDSVCKTSQTGGATSLFTLLGPFKMPTIASLLLEGIRLRGQVLILFARLEFCVCVE